MAKRRHGWEAWKWPAIVAGTVTALGAVGTAILTASTYIGLPHRLEANEAIDKEQQTILERLAVIQEQNKQLMQQQVQQQAYPNAPVRRPAPSEGLREWDAEGVCWACPSEDVDFCYKEQLWHVCD